MPWKFNPFTKKLDYYETGGAPTTPGALLKEDGDNLLLEDGTSNLLKETP